MHTTHFLILLNVTNPIIVNGPLKTGPHMKQMQNTFKTFVQYQVFTMN